MTNISKTKQNIKEYPNLYLHYTFICLIVISFVLSIFTIASSVMQINKPFMGFRMEPTLTVSAVNERYWPGVIAGVKEYDKILKINDKEVFFPREVQEFIRNSKPGDKIKYTISHKGKSANETTDIIVPVTIFTANDFLRSFMTIFAVGLAFLIVGTIAYLIKPANKITQAHLLLMIAVGLTSVFANDFDTTMLFPRIWIIAIAMTGATSIHLGLIFPTEKRIVQKWPLIVYIPYIIGLLLCGAWEFVYQEQGFLKMGESAFNAHFELYDLNLAWALLGGFGGMLGIMIHSLFTIKDEKLRQQLKVGLYGAIVAFAPMIFLWALPLMLEHPLDSTGTIAAVCWVLFIAFPISITYAVVKHKLFDIDFVIKQSMVYSTLLAFLGGIYSLLATALQYILVQLTGKPSEITYFVLTIFVALLFDPARSYIRNFIDKKFFREKYNLRMALSEFVEQVGTTLDTEDVFSGINAILKKYFHPKHFSVFLKVHAKNSLILKYSENFPADKCSELSLDNPFVRKTFNLANIVMDVKKGTAKFTGKLPDIQPLEELNIDVSIPIVARTKESTTALEFTNEIIGLLNLGPKLSEMDYTIEEEELLNKLMQQVALTIHHAQLADEVVEKERMKAEFEKARAIQRAMLPQEELKIEGFQITGFMESADETGGDYYDWYTLPNNQFIVGLGDVTGHGIDAAMIVAMAKSCLYTQINIEYEVPVVLKALNSSIYDFSHRQAGIRKLMSFVYAVFDVEKSSMRISSAGHWFPYVYQAQEGVIDNFANLKPTYPLGVRPTDKFRCQTGEYILQTGDVLVFFTDGLHEAVNIHEEEFGFERLENLIKEHHDLDASDIKDKIIEEWNTFIGEQKPNDDITVLVVKKV